MGVINSHGTAEEYDQGFGLPDPFPTTPEGVEEAQWSDPSRHGPREADVRWTFQDGGFVVKFNYAGGRFDPLPFAWYYVPDWAEDHGDWVGVKGYYRRSARARRAYTFGLLNEQTDFWPDGLEKEAIPIEVASASNKAVAAYLFARWEMSPSQIADRMDKSQSTISQYLSDFKAGRSG